VSQADPVRVLIVDDSALMRKLLADILKPVHSVLVVGTARDGTEALELAAKLKPDVVTLDVEMPGRTGLDILPTLLKVHPLSVIMVSSHTQEGADVTLAALELGAFDFLPKPDRHQVTQLLDSRDLLVSKILAAADARGNRRSTPPPVLGRPIRVKSRIIDTDLDLPTSPKSSLCIVIGISTGGPQALGEILPKLSPPIPPILIVQHMPGQFTSVFAERLNRACAVVVKEAEDGNKIVPDRILIAPGGRHMKVIGQAPHARVSIYDGPPVSGHRPSVDVLFTTASKAFRDQTIGFIMTGMGRDGVDGCRAILSAGGTTYGQDEATSAVYGMNKIAKLEGVVGTQFALDQLTSLIARYS
jgi:two-component system chemotaxis response regulator CheB